MSGTSSRTSSSTSGRGSFSSSSPERGSMQHGVAVAQPHVDGARRAARTTRSSSARPTISARRRRRGSSLKVTTSPVSSAAAGQHDVERLVEHDLGPAVERLVVELGVERHAHLAPAGEHVDGAVVVVAEQRAVGRRGLGELVDLLAQRGDVLARLAQGVGQLLVLRHRLASWPLVSSSRSSRVRTRFGRVLQPAAQRERPPPRGPGRAPGARPAPPGLRTGRRAR